jgi:hypothetical protein
MKMILQLNPRIPLMTPKGPGEAIIFRDPGPDHDDLWTVLLQSNVVWTFKNSEVRGVENITENRLKKLYPDWDKVSSALSPNPKDCQHSRIDY